MLPTVREAFAEDLVSRGVMRPDEPAALLKAGLDELQRIRESVPEHSPVVVAGVTAGALPPKVPAFWYSMMPVGA